MKILQKRTVSILHIEYDNLKPEALKETLEECDKKFGKYNYEIKRSGPKPSTSNEGLLIIHVNGDV